MGIYKWPDGKEYQGEYISDKKDGFGSYKLEDERKYLGWWKHGKQHGLGTFMNVEGASKCGIWEEGQRIRWLEKAEQTQITSGLFDFRVLFNKDSNKEQEITNPLEFGFEQPKYL